MILQNVGRGGGNIKICIHYGSVINIISLKTLLVRGTYDFATVARTNENVFAF